VHLEDLVRDAVHPKEDPEVELPAVRPVDVLVEEDPALLARQATHLDSVDGM
jgi:hypothetical protein